PLRLRIGRHRGLEGRPHGPGRPPRRVAHGDGEAGRRSLGACPGRGGDMASLDRLGERGFIDLVAGLSRALRPRPVLGIGDDAAVLALPPRAEVLLTTDLLTEGIHFRAAYTPGFLLGRKALAVNLSDIAAMGGVPHSFVAAIGFPRHT